MCGDEFEAAARCNRVCPDSMPADCPQARLCDVLRSAGKSFLSECSFLHPDDVVSMSTSCDLKDSEGKPLHLFIQICLDSIS